MTSRTVRCSILTAALLALGASGCERSKGPAERSGERVDRAAEKAGDSIERAGDRTRERLDRK